MRGHAKRIPEGMGRLPLMNTALRKPKHEELCRFTAAIGAILTADKIDREYKNPINNKVFSQVPPASCI